MNIHNKKRLILCEAIILASGMTILLLAILFPPWLRPIVFSGEPSYVRCWIGSTPNYYGDPGFVLAWDKLLFEWVLVVSVTSGLSICIHFLDKNHRRHREQHRTRNKVCTKIFHRGEKEC